MNWLKSAENELWVLALCFISAVVSHEIWSVGAGSNFKQYVGFVFLFGSTFLVFLPLLFYWKNQKLVEREDTLLIKRVFFFGLLAFSFYHLIADFNLGALTASILQILFVARFGKKWERALFSQYKKLFTRWQWILSWFMISWGIWHVMIRLVWFERPLYYSLLSGRLDYPFVFHVCLFITILSFIKLRPSLFWVKKEIFPLLLLGVGSFQTPRKILGVFIHHWGPFVGSASLIQSGGTPYYDVPSQYGLLSLFSFCFLPFKNVWTQFYVFQAACLWVSSWIIYYFTRRIFTSRSFCFFLTFSIALCIPGWADGAIGPYAFPSSGPVRFIWVYVLLALLSYFSSLTIKNLENKDFFLFSLAWCLGSLWSAESFIYSSAFFFPAYVLLAFEGRKQKAWKGRLLIPFGLMSIFLLILSLLFQVFFDSRPEWMGFFEYAFSFSRGFSPDGKLIDPSGSVWILILFLALLVNGFILQMKSHTPLREKGVILSLISGFVALGSYYFGRGHENNILNAVPIYTLIFLIFRMQFQERVPWFTHVISALLVPFIVVNLTTTFRSLREISAIFRHANKISNYDISSRVIRANDENNQLLSLMNEAGVSPADPMVSDDANLPDAHPLWNEDQHPLFWKPWLPITPAALFEPLSDERMKIYIDRYVRRVQLSGWYLQPKNKTVMKHVRIVLSRVLPLYFKPTRRFENKSWILTWYEYKQGDLNSISSPKPRNLLQ